MDFRINGRAVAVDVDLRTSLLDLLRDHLPDRLQEGLQPGRLRACTVLVDGERINRGRPSCAPGVPGHLRPAALMATSTSPSSHEPKGMARSR